MLPLAACLHLVFFIGLAISEDTSDKPLPQTMKDLLMMDVHSTCRRGELEPNETSIPHGCVDKNGSACLQYSLPMAQAFTALATAAQCGPNANLKSWSCADCRKVGFDVVPQSMEVITGKEIFQGHSTSVYVAQVKGSFPGSKPRPAEAVKHTAEDCWDHCRKTAGYCDWCGVGNICKEAFTGSGQCVMGKSLHTDGQHPGNMTPSVDTNFSQRDYWTETGAKEAASEEIFGCVLAVRGSKNVDNWIMNFVFPMEDMNFGDQCPGCKGVTGWLTVWREIEPKIMSTLNSLGCVPGSSRGNLLVTGHSLGAAVAALGMFHLQRKGYNVVQSYNFESTRVGNQAWSAAFQIAFGRDVPVFRVTHSIDVVPRVPPQLEVLHLGFDYKHVASEVFFPGEDSSINVICETAEDKRCADRQWWLPLLLTELSRGFKDHCTGPLGEHNDFCACPVSHMSGSNGPDPHEDSYVV